MYDQQKKVYTNRLKLSRNNYDSSDGKYKATATYTDGNKVDFAFEPKVYINRNGEECIGNIYIPGYNYYISIKKRQNKMGKIYYSGCVDYEKNLYVNMNIVATSDTIGEYTISFSKPADVIDIKDNEEKGLPF